MIASMKEAAQAAPSSEPTPAPIVAPEVVSTPTPTPTAQSEVASTPTEATPTPNTETAVVPATDRTVANYVEDADAEGEFDESDSIRATMVITAKTGKMSDTFTPGDIVINKNVVIGGTKTPIEFVTIAIKKRYQNDLHNKLKKMGDIVDTADQVLARGGIVEYRHNDDETSTHFWKPILQTVLLVKRPKDCSPAAAAYFMIEIEDQFYAPVGYTARAKSQYNRIAKVLIDTKKKKGTVRTTVFRLSVKSETWEAGNRSWIDPTTTPIGDTSAKVVEFLKEYVG